MKKTFIAIAGCIAIIYVPIVLAWGMTEKEERTTCYGRTPCNACSNCKYCKHCAQEGGSCGICK